MLYINDLYESEYVNNNKKDDQVPVDKKNKVNETVNEKTDKAKSKISSLTSSVSSSVSSYTPDVVKNTYSQIKNKVSPSHNPKNKKEKLIQENPEPSQVPNQDPVVVSNKKNPELKSILKQNNEVYYISYTEFKKNVKNNPKVYQNYDVFMNSKNYTIIDYYNLASTTRQVFASLIIIISVLLIFNNLIKLFNDNSSKNNNRSRHMIRILVGVIGLYLSWLVVSKDKTNHQVILRKK